VNGELPCGSVYEEHQELQVAFVPVALLAGGLQVVPAHLRATMGSRDDVILCPVVFVEPATTVDAKQGPYHPTVEVVLGREHPRHVVVEDVLDRHVLEMADTSKLLNLSSTGTLK